MPAGAALAVLLACGPALAQTPAPDSFDPPRPALEAPAPDSFDADSGPGPAASIAVLEQPMFPYGTAQPSDLFVARADAPDPAAKSGDAAAAKAGYPPTEDLFSKAYAKSIYYDYKDVLTAPLRWGRDDWRTLGLISVGIALTVATLDKPTRDLVQKNQTAWQDHFFNWVEDFGTRHYTNPVIAGFYLYGKFGEDDNAKATGLDLLTASMVSNTITSALKGVFGRARPFTEEGPYHWRPFGGDTSFPSGHTTQAFTMASVIAHHYDSPWVQYGMYGLATTVGYARMYHDKHWLSDVIGGALVGSFTGREIVRFNRETRSERTGWVPQVGTDGQSLTLNWAY